MINLSRSITEQSLPGAFFSNAASHSEFVPERQAYETAVQAFAAQTSPAALRAYVAAFRRRGFRVTQADARQAAAETLRDILLTLGYTQAGIDRHAARRGRRDRHLFAASVRALESVIEDSPCMGKWRGPYHRHH